MDHLCPPRIYSDINIESRAAWPHFRLMSLYRIYFCSHTFSLSQSLLSHLHLFLFSMQAHFLSIHRVLHLRETTKTPPILSEVSLEPHGSSCLWCLPSPISSVLPHWPLQLHGGSDQFQLHPRRPPQLDSRYTELVEKALLLQTLKDAPGSITHGAIDRYVSIWELL